MSMTIKFRGVEPFREMNKLPAVVAELDRIAHAIAASADANAGTPGGHLVLPGEIGDRRARRAVLTRSGAARRAESRNHTLTRALLEGRR